MRIVGGKFKGRIFHPGKRFKARPTTDFAKENLFNILENRMNWEEISALDLFSGTGSISYELISRGCKQVTSVERDYKHFQFINEIKHELKIDNLSVVRGDALKFAEKSTQKFDLIFCDPPYEMKNFNAVPQTILDANILTLEGILIVEHNKQHDFSQLPQFQEVRTYGSVNFSFFGNNG